MPCAGSRWPAEARGSPAPAPSASRPCPSERRRVRRCRPRPSSPTHSASAPCSRSWPRSTSPPPSARHARLRDPEPSAPHGRGPREKTCSSSCLSWLHLLRSWSLRQTRGGSDAYAQGACPDTANVGSGLQQINVPAGSNVVVLVTRAKNEASMVEVCSGDGAALQQRRREGTNRGGPVTWTDSANWRGSDGKPINSKPFIVKVTSVRLESPGVEKSWNGMARIPVTPPVKIAKCISIGTTPAALRIGIQTQQSASTRPTQTLAEATPPHRGNPAAAAGLIDLGKNPRRFSWRGFRFGSKEKAPASGASALISSNGVELTSMSFASLTRVGASMPFGNGDAPAMFA